MASFLNSTHSTRSKLQREPRQTRVTILWSTHCGFKPNSGEDNIRTVYQSVEMNCARVLHAFGSHPPPAVMPVDLAKCLSLSKRQPLYQRLSTSPLKPTQRRYQPANCLPRTGLRSPHPSFSSPFASSSSLPSSPVSSEPRSCFRRDSNGLNKKRVIFADAKGLALTAVRLFIPEAPSPASTLVMKPSLAQLQGQQLTSNKLQRYKLRLGFPQPTLDFKAFVARLRDMRVQLERCKVSEHSLSGKVRVSHVGIDKAVHVRVTFDSWRSHHDIPCTFLQQQRYGGCDMDVFAFDLSLPKNIDPNERVEFCVSLTPGPGSTPHWDDNMGQNYRVCVEKTDRMVVKATLTAVTPHFRTIGHHRGLHMCPSGCKTLLIYNFRGVCQAESEQSGTTK